MMNKKNKYNISIEITGDFEVESDSLANAYKEIESKLNLPKECKIIAMRGTKTTGGQ